MKAFTEATLILGFILLNCTNASSSSDRPQPSRFGRRTLHDNGHERQMTAVDATTTTTAMRPLSPSRASSPIPMHNTGRSEVEEDTTTTTLSPEDTSLDHDDPPSTVWSRWQKRLPLPLQPRGSSFDIVPLPRERTKRTASSFFPSKRSRSNNNNKSSSGTRFDVRPPSPERLSKWFGSMDAKQGRSRKTVTQLFNHDSVGMTNPVLHINLDQEDDQNNQYLGVDYDPTSSSASVSLASSATPARHHHQQQQFELHDSWIPASTTTTITSPQQQSTAKKNNGWAHVLQYKLKAAPAERNGAEQAWFPSAPSPQQQQQQKKWRQCRYRRRVGQGQACYERVRDAVLAWQFNHTEHPTQGILPVYATHSQQQPRQKNSDSNSNNDCFQLDDRTSQHVQPIWSGPHTEGSRRLVTFTSTGFKTKWLPKLYTMNPVMVVYDLLDQRGPETTYSSTAYATLKGHLLRGEERVTVAMRDDTGFVDVEILSLSRPAGSLKSKFVWPLIGNMQQTFFQNQMNFLEQIAVPAPPSLATAVPAQ